MMHMEICCNITEKINKLTTKDIMWKIFVGSNEASYFTQAEIISQKNMTFLEVKPKSQCWQRFLIIN